MFPSLWFPFINFPFLSFNVVLFISWNFSTIIYSWCESQSKARQKNKIAVFCNSYYETVPWIETANFLFSILCIVCSVLCILTSACCFHGNLQIDVFLFGLEFVPRRKSIFCSDNDYLDTCHICWARCYQDDFWEIFFNINQEMLIEKIITYRVLPAFSLCSSFISPSLAVVVF